MKRNLLLAALIVGAPLAVVLGWLLKYTTYLSFNHYPKGVVLSWYQDSVVCSGQVKPWSSYSMMHGGVADFLIVSDKMIEFPAGFMPYFLKVNNSHYRIAVDKLLGGYNGRLYLIDDDTKSMFPVETPGIDVARFGSEIGNTIHPGGVTASFNSDKGLIEVIFGSVSDPGMTLTLDPIKRVMAGYKVREDQAWMFLKK